MKGKCQKLYRHSVQKDTTVTKPRINLTFRLVLDGGGDGEKIELITQQPIETQKESPSKSESEVSGRDPGRRKPRIQGRGGVTSGPLRGGGATSGRGGRTSGRGRQSKT